MSAKVARGLNKVMIIGTVGRRPEMRFTPSGIPVTNFSVGVQRQWTTSHGEAREATEWFNVVAWSDLAEQSNQQLQSEALVYVEGSLQTRSWEDNEGNRHHGTELVAERVTLLSEMPA